MHNAKHLLIFPGGASPCATSDAYNLLEREALKHGFTDVSTLLFPGQADRNGHISGDLTLDSSLEYAKTVVEDFESKSIEYSIIGRSYGTIVSAKLVHDMNLKHLNKFILWGIPPYWMNWKLCYDEYDSYSNQLEQKGCRFTKQFFNSTVPVEPLLAALSSFEKPDKIIIANGSLDEVSPPAFNEYLRSIVGFSSKIEFRIINGVAHSVTEANRNWQNYIGGLFS